MASTIIDHPVVQLLKDLMSIVSTSELEHDIGVFLEQHPQSLGYTVERIPIAPGSTRHNVYAYLGSSRKTRVLLTAHMDTVPPHIPLSLDGDIVRGRGSSDDLGPLAAQIVAAEELRREGKIQAEGDIGLLFVVGEENGGHGMIAANDMGVVCEAGIFAEPTESKLAKNTRDKSRSRSSLGGSPATWPKSDLLGPSTFNIGTLEGGEKHNIVPPSAKALCEVRMVSDLPGVKTQIGEIVSRHPDIELKWVFEYPEALLDWEIDGVDAAPVAFGTDVPRLQDRWCGKRVLYGPGSILVAHGPNEYIRIPELIESIAGYKKLVLHFLQ
ncbi:hypothetical protein AYO20_11283 [Fonsecaea nubica]|uniref:Peptidase M20 dimerisation domain-containing protein n=1 Tax=Fonsecaea nubica TaxID=856822 RepID=A0A178BXI4_9EURO|nr:hypothetical protein AYO20_11283 [Fonsecaea nubica]OAL22047.1 hypothetical protein AYO20_11283 [Fonsecaea nubica]